MTDKFKIDKNVPIPAQVRPGKPEKYPWSKMKAGDSIFIAGKVAGRMSGMLSARRRRGEKFVCRTVTEGGVKGVRVWRLE